MLDPDRLARPPTLRWPGRPRLGRWRKLTAHRLIARDALRHLPSCVRPGRRSPDADPLPGFGGADTARLGALDPAAAAYLVSLYGAHAARLLAYGDLPDAFERIHPDAPDVWAQAHYAVDREWALTAADVAHRRTSLGMRGLVTDTLLGEIGARLETEVVRL